MSPSTSTAGENLGLVGESGCGQEHGGLLDRQFPGPQRPGHPRRHPLQGRAAARPLRRGPAQAARRRHLHGLPGADVGAQPVHAHPGPDGREPDHPSRLCQRKAAYAEVARGAQDGLHARPRRRSCDATRTSFRADSSSAS